MREAKILHRILRRVAGWAVISFFTEIHVIGGENVPEHGPIIVASTHHNMMLDPAVLSRAFPYHRVLHYWAKASLFANPFASYILTSAGNIPVDRKSKDRQKLYHGTFEALSNGLAVALFPEGTSYTEPRIMQVKDGAAWAALEYTKWVLEKGQGSPVVIVPAAIVYTNKSKYRSDVILEFGQPIPMTDFMDQFLSGVDGAARAAAKKVTATLGQKLVEMTINAPDWDTLYAARMARDLLWEKERSINLDEFVPISQTLVDLFCTPDLVPNMSAIKRHLLTYYSLLQSTHLTNSVLSSLPLPQALDPYRPTPLPSRLMTLTILIRDTLSVLIRLPFFLFPLLVHLPAYVVGRLGAKLVEDEEETQAQNKVVFGMLLVTTVYFLAFFFVWAFLRYTPFGAVLAAVFVILIANYHNKLINDNYQHMKRLVATWRVLIGVWAPKRWDLSLSALAQYTIPSIPPENLWVDRTKVRSRPPTPSLPSDSPAPSSSKSASASSPGPNASSHKRRRPPTRRIMRHVLRARVEAAKALTSLFEQLEQAGEDKRVRASRHLARLFGGGLLSADIAADEGKESGEGVIADEDEPAGWRSAKEVVKYLRDRGARLKVFEQRVEGEWAALSSEGEGTEVDSDAAMGEDIVWVPSRDGGDRD